MCTTPTYFPITRDMQSLSLPDVGKLLLMPVPCGIQNRHLSWKTVDKWLLYGFHKVSGFFDNILPLSNKKIVWLKKLLPSRVIEVSFRETGKITGTTGPERKFTSTTFHTLSCRTKFVLEKAKNFHGATFRDISTQTKCTQTRHD